MMSSLPVMVIAYMLVLVIHFNWRKDLLSLLNSNTIPQIALTWLTNKLSAGVLDRAKCSQSCCRTSAEGPLPDADNLGKTCSSDYYSNPSFLLAIFSDWIFSKGWFMLAILSNCILWMTSWYWFESHQAWMERVHTAASPSCKPSICTPLLQCCSHSWKFIDNIFNSTWYLSI